MNNLANDSLDFSWISAHLSDDTTRLRLKYGHNYADEILQIECRRKFGTKLADTLAANPEFIFPTALSGEQSTSDRLARFHASLVRHDKTVADLTAGLGIDAMAIAVKADHVVAVERNEQVANALRINSDKLDNFKVICGDCSDVIKIWGKDGRRFDCLFIDPARRTADGRRIYALDQCEPDVVAMLPDLQKATNRLIVKASPMLDVTHTLNLLPYAVEIIVPGTPTECKELDIVCEFNKPIGEPLIRAVTLGPDFQSTFEFTKAEEAAAKTEFGVPKPGDYIYDPYPTVMKAAPMKLLGERFGLKKLAPNTHLWTSDKLITDFPGRTFIATEILPYMSKHIKRYASRHHAVSVTTRNFDMTAGALRAKLHVADGPTRLFAASTTNERLLITCKDISSYQNP